MNSQAASRKTRNETIHCISSNWGSWRNHLKNFSPSRLFPVDFHWNKGEIVATIDVWIWRAKTHFAFFNREGRKWIWLRVSLKLHGIMSSPSLFELIFIDGNTYKKEIICSCPKPRPTELKSFFSKKESSTRDGFDSNPNMRFGKQSVISPWDYGNCSPTNIANNERVDCAWNLLWACQPQIDKFLSICACKIPEMTKWVLYDMHAY